HGVPVGVIVDVIGGHSEACPGDLIGSCWHCLIGGDVTQGADTSDHLIQGEIDSTRNRLGARDPSYLSDLLGIDRDRDLALGHTCSHTIFRGAYPSSSVYIYGTDRRFARPGAEKFGACHRGPDLPSIV